jgi:thiol:disulfide interchange protein DsbD
MRLSATLFFMLLLGVLDAQNPVQWSFAAQKVSDAEYNLIFTAQVAQGWYLYSQYMESEEGPIPTSFAFEENPNYELSGETREEGNRKEAFDDIFGMTLVKYTDQVTFTQKVILKGSIEKINGSLDFMTCDDERCLPPKTVPFEIPL